MFLLTLSSHRTSEEQDDDIATNLHDAAAVVRRATLVAKQFADAEMPVGHDMPWVQLLMPSTGYPLSPGDAADFAWFLVRFK